MRAEPCTICGNIVTPTAEPWAHTSTGIGHRDCCAPTPTPTLATPRSTETVFSLPRTFYDDHVDRDLPGGRIIKTTQRQVTVALTQPELAELKSDAEYYASEWRHMGPAYRHLGQSAKATVTAINRQHP